MSSERYIPGESFKIREQISPRTPEALMSNYKDAQQAFLELIDNAVDNRMMDGVTPIEVRIRVTKDELTIFNIGGRGLDAEGLEKFFVWGYSEKTAREIGFYGVGGKAAMGYLGRSMEVACSPAGSDLEFQVKDENWESREDDKLKEFDAKVARASSDKGYFRARVTNLKGQIQTQALINKLADIYRPLLLTGEVKMTVNNKPIEPKEVKYIEEPRELASRTMVLQTKFGDEIPLKVGVLADDQRIKPGIRCYYHGRLIEDEEYFGLPTPAQMHQMSRFFGEVHLDAMTVTSNKEHFVRNDPRWDIASRQVRQVLQPFVDRLSRQQFQEVSLVENFEKETAKRAKRILEGVFATTQIVTKAMLPGGESSGRRPATGNSRPLPQGGTRRATPVEGRTAPGPDATEGVDKVKRWGAFAAWEVSPMGANGKRSDVVKNDGRDTLIINSDHPFYQANKRVDDSALELYIVETAVLKIAETISREGSVEEYVDFTNVLLTEVGQVYKNRVSSSGQRRGRRS